MTIHSSRVEKRDVNAGHVFEVNAYGENVKAWITPTEGILAGVNTPICGVRSRSDGGIDIYKYPNVSTQILHLCLFSDCKEICIVNFSVKLKLIKN